MASETKIYLDAEGQQQFNRRTAGSGTLLGHVGYSVWNEP
jgi:hypothetical protein